jgi:hypothetical protein
MDKPFTSKHCTPLNMGTPLHQAGFSTTEESTKPEGEIRPISDLGITEKDLRLGGSLPVGGAGAKGVVKGLVKLGAKAIKKYKESK